MVSKVRNVRLGVFSGGGCHHPNKIETKLELADVTLFIMGHLIYTSIQKVKTVKDKIMYMT